jgi:hypothetical protein
MKKPTFLDNQFKGLQVEETRPVKYANVVRTYVISIAIMGLILAGLAIAHKYGLIECSKTQWP